jgi:hypothetical protein
MLADQIDWKRVRLPEEFRAITRLLPKIERVRNEVNKRAMIQDTEIFSAFDEVDWFLASIELKPRYDRERN